MKKQVVKIFFLLAVLLAAPGFALGAPSIDDTSGIVTQGQSVTISGADFGTGAAIIQWDDMEAHTVGTQVMGQTPIVGPGFWTHHTGNPGFNAGILFSDTQAHSGTKSVNVNWQTAGTIIAGFGWQGAGQDSLYFTYWRYMDHPDDDLPQPPNNHKSVYLFGTDGNYPMMISNVSWNTWGTNNNSTRPTIPFAYPSDYNNGKGNPARSWASTRMQWNRWEYWVKVNTVPDCDSHPDIDWGAASECDGERAEWIDAQLYYSGNKYKWRDTYSNYYQAAFGVMHGQDVPQPGSVYMDDLYIATSKARVEIGNNAVFENCTHREIQRHTAWADGSATITVNRGSFDENDSAYLFVIDSTGVASAGKLITFGASVEDTIAPNNPSGLLVM